MFRFNENGKKIDNLTVRAVEQLNRTSTRTTNRIKKIIFCKKKEKKRMLY